MAFRILIIEYGMGNVRSVANAFEALGASVMVRSSPEETEKADALILPGVGAFADGMKNLRERGWVDALQEEVKEKQKPFLGLCLGMQLLATQGTEHGMHQGFGWINGIVNRLPESKDATIRIPHIGWNDVNFTKTNGLYKGLQSPQSFYFVHSYILHSESDNVISGTCHHGMDFTASIELENIFATQFHPEKSHKMGLAVLRNFLSALA